MNDTTPAPTATAAPTPLTAPTSPMERIARAFGDHELLPHVTRFLEALFPGEELAGTRRDWLNWLGMSAWGATPTPTPAMLVDGLLQRRWKVLPNHLTPKVGDCWVEVDTTGAVIDGGWVVKVAVDGRSFNSSNGTRKSIADAEHPVSYFLRGDCPTCNKATLPGQRRP